MSRTSTLLPLSTPSPSWSLEDSTLRLLLVKRQVAPDHNADDDCRQERTARDNHVPLNVGVGADDAVANGVADRVAHLLGDLAKDDPGLRLCAIRQLVVQPAGQLVGPDGPRDGEPDGLADGAEHGVEREHDGELLVRDGRHDGQRRRHGPDAAAHTVEDLTHDEVAQGVAGLAEVDEQSGAEDAEGDAGDGGPVVAPVPAQEEADEGGQDGRGDGEGVEGVSRDRDAQVVDNLEVGAVVRVPGTGSPASVSYAFREHDTRARTLTR